MTDPQLIAKNYFQSIKDNHPDMIFTTDLQGNMIMANHAFTNLTGLKEEEVEGKSCFFLFSPTQIEEMKTVFAAFIKEKDRKVEIDLEIRIGNQIEAYAFQIIPIMIQQTCAEILFIGRNETEKLALKEEIKRLTFYDEQTGLPNRLHIEEELTRKILLAKKAKQAFYLFFIQVDRVKTVNDALGHSYGDSARRLAAKRIQSVLPSGAFLGRFSTDKYAVLLDMGLQEESWNIALHILREVRRPFHFEKQEFYLDASIGVSQYPYDGNDKSVLLKNAGIALRRTKIGIHKDIVFYADEMDREMNERVVLERGLRKALENDEFFLVYQPIMNAGTGEMIACEALLRWEHPNYGIVPPMKFIPIAEETGLIHSLGNWILESACKQAKTWQEKGHKEICVSVNVSPYQLESSRFVENVAYALAESGLEANYLQLELTESVMIDKSKKTLETLHQLMSMGIQISIDDFGTGYSSLSYLKQFPINTLKIDRSFIQNLTERSPDFAIVDAILTMGQGLGIQVVAEGIETNDQLKTLVRLGCMFVQGFLIEKPMEARRFTCWLRNKKK